jgi:hypothetical protein
MTDHEIPLRTPRRCAAALLLVCLSACGGSADSNAYAGTWTEFVVTQGCPTPGVACDPPPPSRVGPVAISSDGNFHFTACSTSTSAGIPVTGTISASGVVSGHFEGQSCTFGASCSSVYYCSGGFSGSCFWCSGTPGGWTLQR